MQDPKPQVGWMAPAMAEFYEDYLRKTGDLIQQNSKYWAAWRTFNQSCRENWTEVFTNMTRIMNSNMQDLLVLYAPSRSVAEGDMELKKTLEQKQQEIHIQQAKLEQQRRQIDELAQKVQLQSDRLRKLEAEAQKTAQPKADAPKRQSSARIPKGEKKSVQV